MLALLDLLLAMALLGLALGAVAGAALFRSIVMFVVFGLMLAVVWGRLGAPDLALAEAALGAGLTGALLLVSYRRLVHSRPARRPRSRPAARLALPLGLLTALLVLGLGLGLVLDSPPLATAPEGTASLVAVGPASAGQAVLARMDDLPLDNPVTAVLLLFRGYDTLLEMMVLLAAWLGARLALAGSEPLPARSAPAALPPLGGLLSLVVPLGVLVALHLLLSGSRQPGGAFQAGAVLAAAGVLLVLAGRLQGLPHRALPPRGQRLLLVLGGMAFMACALAARLGGGTLFALDAVPGLALMGVVLLIETAMMLSIALTLVLLFASASGLAWGRE